MKISIAPNGRHYVTESGKPFFWLADTAWNAALRGDTEDWQLYLETRKKQGFTAIQFVTSPWRGCHNPVHGNLFEETDSGVTYDENAWQKMGEWISMVVDHGLVPAPVMIWENNLKGELPHTTENCITVGKRMVKEWSKFEPVWIVAGDSDYRTLQEDKKWKTIGRAVFGDHPDAIATMHPCGVTWVGDQFADEPWYGMVGIQSGHGADDGALNFLVAGAYTQRWRDIKKPFINLEPNYELASAYEDPDKHFDAFYIRRATYWSLLGAPPAGITYGNSPIWIWAQEQGETAEGHDSIWVSDKWTSGLETPGIQSLQVMLKIMQRLRWTELLPADELLTNQPGYKKAIWYQKVAATLDRTLVVLYTPTGGCPRISKALLGQGYRGTWLNPRSGKETPFTVDPNHGYYEEEAPSKEDWLMVFEK